MVRSVLEINTQKNLGGLRGLSERISRAGLKRVLAKFAKPAKGGESGGGKGARVLGVRSVTESNTQRNLGELRGLCEKTSRAGVKRVLAKFAKPAKRGKPSGGKGAEVLRVRSVTGINTQRNLGGPCGLCERISRAGVKKVLAKFAKPAKGGESGGGEGARVLGVRSVTESNTQRNLGELRGLCERTSRAGVKRVLAKAAKPAKGGKPSGGTGAEVLRVRSVTGSTLKETFAGLAAFARKLQELE